MQHRAVGGGRVRPVGDDRFGTGARPAPVKTGDPDVGQHRLQRRPPIRRCGLGGTGHCEVLAFDEGKMLRIAWRAADENMSGLDSAVTFTVAPEGAGTRLLIEHNGLHPCPYVITGIACGPRGGRTSTRRIGEVPATAGAWRASIRRISEALAGDAADREG